MFEYKCKNCGTHYTTSKNTGDRNPSPCTECDSLDDLVRVFSFSVAPVMQEHWNNSVDAPISSMTQYKEKLKQKSEEHSEYSGIEHRYEPVDIQDTKSLGVTGEGLDATNRVRRANGQRTIDLDKL